jgi:hypothetical protein
MAAGSASRITPAKAKKDRPKKLRKKGKKTTSALYGILPLAAT